MMRRSSCRSIGINPPRRWVVDNFWGGVVNIRKEGGPGTMRRIVGIIQARMGARRLPGKVLLDLEGKAVLEHVIDRVRRSKLIEDTVAATTIKKEDLKIVRLASKKGVRVYCGQEDDVLDR